MAKHRSPGRTYTTPKLPKRLTKRPCLRCEKPMLSEGPNHRLCQGCRKVLNDAVSVVEPHRPLLPGWRGRA